MEVTKLLFTKPAVAICVQTLFFCPVGTLAIGTASKLSTPSTPAVSNSRSAGFSLFTAVCPRWRHRSNHLPFAQKSLDAVRVRTLFFFRAMTLAKGQHLKLSTPSTPAVSNSRPAGFSLFTAVCPRWRHRSNHLPFPQKSLDAVRVRTLFFYPAMALATGAASKLSTPSTPAVSNSRPAVFLFMSVWAALAQAGRQGGKLFASKFLQNQRRDLFFFPIQP